MDNTAITLFKEKKVRKTFFQKEWWFAIEDMIEVLTRASNPGKYLEEIRRQDSELVKIMDERSKEFKQPRFLNVITHERKEKLYCWNTEGILRLVQSIYSPKAENFKKLLAKIAYERMRETDDPELATKRTRLLYKSKGYSDEWIKRRMHGIAIREELTDEWRKRGAKESKDYKSLSKSITRATFGMTPRQHKKVKGLKKDNLRDHMNDLELIFAMLGERSAIEIHRQEETRSLSKLKKDVRIGGKIARSAREELEKKLKHSIVTKNNLLDKSKRIKK
ncbi:MAG: Prophage antirepressor [Candidatus Moranbacteria bacterium GW2011_GWF2_34_56]|nr:MAG: Prophage antirepressor [Candidatus Moranbacteria bacterium GW2011_GWF2_34_56]HBI17660.1 phage antirepressor protein [Candidatus Moranbacteria bacterium]